MVKGIYLFETKTKGDINEQQLKAQLASGFDLQTMIYLIALDEDRRHHHAFRYRDDCNAYLGGVRYNVVRRPLSGGRHSIVQKKGSKNVAPESSEEFYARLSGLIESEPDYFFMRWKVEVTPTDLERFRRECLDPLLEQLCDWWEWIVEAYEENRNPFENPVHWRTPYGFYNVLAEGGTSEVDEYLNTGSTLGLERTNNLFPELSNA